MNKKITFTEFANDFVYVLPQPAKNFVPEWYQNTSEFTNNIGPTLDIDKSILLNITVKKCMPVKDAIDLGYMLILDVDIYVDINESGEQVFRWPTGLGIDFHLFEQADKHPKATVGENFPRWKLPWIITTPKKYSCLLIPPMHRDNVFEILPAVIDTDVFPTQVNIPFVMKDKKFTGIIPKNTPIAQIIPFKRESWKIKKGNTKNIIEFDEKLYRLRSLFVDKYKRMFWQRKNYD